MDQNKRLNTILRAGIIGILVNIFLASTKVFIGLLVNSLAMMVDALNNISDIFSSLVTVIGARLAAQSPDTEHPQGHGRYEYISGFLVAGFIFYSGMLALGKSVQRILYPHSPSYTSWSLLFVVVAILCKLLLAKYTDSQGKRIHSESLRTLAKDSLLDAFVSFCTLIAGVAYFAFDFRELEGYFGLLLSLFYIYSGIRSLRTNISSILGERVRKEISVSVNQAIMAFPEIEGAYDLIFADYGPDQLRASVRIKVSEKLTALEIDDLSRAIEKSVYRETNVLMTAIGIYADCAEEKELEKEVTDFILSFPEVIQVHGFRIRVLCHNYDSGKKSNKIKGFSASTNY